MGKTIAVKISKKEQQIIAELNRQGMTNSELLRTALQHYFEVLHRKDLLHEQEIRSADSEEITNTMAREYIEYLKREIQDVREQNTKLQQQLYQIQIRNNQEKKENAEEKQENDPDVHHQIDAFLNNQIQKRLP